MRSRYQWRKTAGVALMGLAVLWLLSPHPQAFASRYVDNSCANNGNGTAVGCAASPGGPGAYNTLQTALTAAVAGDVVIVRNNPSGGADYVTTAGTGLAGTGFTFANSGTSGNPIILRNYPGERPVLRACAAGSTTLAACNRATLTAPDREYIRITGDACPTTGATSLGFHIYGAIVLADSGLTEGTMAHGNEVSCTEIERGYAPADEGRWSGLRLSGQYGALVRLNSLHDITAAALTGAGAQAATTCVTTLQTSNATIRFNSCAHVVSTQAGGIDCQTDCVLNTIEYNDLRDVPVCVRLETGETAGGPYTAQGAVGSVIRNNVCVADVPGTRAGIRFDTGIVTSATVANNTIVGFVAGLDEVHTSAVCAGIAQYNNAFYQTSDAHVSLGDGSPGHCTLSLSDYNAYGTAATVPRFKIGATAYNTLADVVAGTAFEDHSQSISEAAFGFAAPGAGDYTLGGASPLRGTGRFGGVSTGAVTDIGAYVAGVSCIGYACTVSGVPGAATLVTVSAPLSSPDTSLLASARKIDWSHAGANIVNRTTNCTTSQCLTLCPGVTASGTPACSSGTVTTSSIQNAVNSAGANTVVWIPSGTYNVGGLMLTASNVTLRGKGASVTKLMMTGSSGCTYAAAISICNGGISVPISGVTSANWTANYTHGSATLVLDNKTGLTVGKTIAVDQLEDPSTDTTEIWHCDGGVTMCMNEGVVPFGRSGRDGQVQWTTVTAIEAGACAPSCDIGIDPPLYMNYRSGRDPEAFWYASDPIQSFGFEDLSVDLVNSGAYQSGIAIDSALNVWVKGIRLTNDGAGQAPANGMLLMGWGRKVTLRDSYFYGDNGGASQHYGVTTYQISDCLVENNIFEMITGPMQSGQSQQGCVWGYNYALRDVFSNPTWMQAGNYNHAIGNNMDLHEGNDSPGFTCDAIHGPSFMSTLFRNRFRGFDNVDGTVMTAQIVPVHLYRICRYFNVIGNVLGEEGVHTAQEGFPTTANDNTNPEGNEAMFQLGWCGNQTGDNGSGLSCNDLRVRATLFRWGNWDVAGETGRFQSGEVPTADAFYPQTVPPSQTLPASFYLSGKPAWFGSIPWPPIGPDVTGGNMTAQDVKGHVYKIPARVCYESMADDPAYAGATTRIFNRATCMPGS